MKFPTKQFHVNDASFRGYTGSVRVPYAEAHRACVVKWGLLRYVFACSNGSWLLTDTRNHHNHGTHANLHTHLSVSCCAYHRAAPTVLLFLVCLALSLVNASQIIPANSKCRLAAFDKQTAYSQQFPTLPHRSECPHLCVNKYAFVHATCYLPTKPFIRVHPPRCLRTRFGHCLMRCNLLRASCYHKFVWVPPKDILNINCTPLYRLRRRHLRYTEPLWQSPCGYNLVLIAEYGTCANP